MGGMLGLGHGHDLTGRAGDSAASTAGNDSLAAMCAALSIRALNITGIRVPTVEHLLEARTFWSDMSSDMIAGSSVPFVSVRAIGDLENSRDAVRGAQLPLFFARLLVLVLFVSMLVFVLAPRPAPRHRKNQTDTELVARTRSCFFDWWASTFCRCVCFEKQAGAVSSPENGDDGIIVWAEDEHDEDRSTSKSSNRGGRGSGFAGSHAERSSTYDAQVGEVGSPLVA